MGRVVAKPPLDKGGKGGGTERLGEVQREGSIMGRNWARLGGENSRWKGFWGRWPANGCFWHCRGEGFCTGSMVARQTAPGCTLCVWTQKGRAQTKRARAEAPRTGVYVMSAWNVLGTGRTGCNRAQGSFFADDFAQWRQRMVDKLKELDIWWRVSGREPQPDATSTLPTGVCALNKYRLTCYWITAKIRNSMEPHICAQYNANGYDEDPALL